MILARCKEELVTAQKKIAELENISLEVDVDKVNKVVYDAECKTIAKLLEEKEQTNMLINQIRRGAEEREKVSELSRELQLQNDAERKYRDEVMHLRLKLDVSSCYSMSSRHSM
uniref:Uncharacterized protein n=1 Tax=Parascaris equorum TaxID=6256 RepID=A0A914RJ83_PAREQ